METIVHDCWTINQAKISSSSDVAAEVVYRCDQQQPAHLRRWMLTGAYLGVTAFMCFACSSATRADGDYRRRLGVERKVGSTVDNASQATSSWATELDLNTSTIPSTLPYECLSSQHTLPSSWDIGSCARGAEHRYWNIAPNGSFLGGDRASCLPSGALSCERRRSAWASPTVVMQPTNPHADMPTLVVFLPGTGSAPERYGRLLHAAAQAGHHVIGLGYLSQPVAVSQFNAWCDPNPPESIASALECNQDAHEKMLFGQSPPSLNGKSAGLWDVPWDFSVENLLVAVLGKVEWGRLFFKGGSVAWSRVIMSGHSQGAGHAAYMSFRRKTRLVQFSGPQDCTTCAAQWLSRMSASSRSVVRRSLFHVHEECGPSPERPQSYCEDNLMLRNLDLMGLGSTRSVWKGAGVPDNLTNVMSVVRPACTDGRSFHNSVAVDTCAPLSEGIVDLWRALFSGLGTKGVS